MINTIKYLCKKLNIVFIYILSRGVVFGGDCEMVCGASRLPCWWLRFVFVLLLPSHVLFQGVVCISPSVVGSFVGISGVSGFVWFGMC